MDMNGVPVVKKGIFPRLLFREWYHYTSLFRCYFLLQVKNSPAVSSGKILQKDKFTHHILELGNNL